ncbi:MAG: DUF4214 domain-containing protein [Clostridia bacterium]|nr:DUF4214 domain-containing protein [Clostridia bacterium]
MRCYDVGLGREPDADGFRYWWNSLNNGEACGAQVGFGFIFSQEYTEKNKTQDEYLIDLYHMFFDREPDVDGYNYWMEKMNDGESRELIFTGFANSVEFNNLCNDYGVVSGWFVPGVLNSQQGGVNCFVARLYRICLGRLPDYEGQAYWVQKLISNELSGSTCAYGFVFSQEFMNKNLSNEEFVGYMYLAFFNREADQDGFDYWVNQMEAGMTQVDVFEGFTGSAEFANLCANYGITV